MEKGKRERDKGSENRGEGTMFRYNLKYLRTVHGYSMDQLCELYNRRYNGKLNKSTLSRYENGLQEPMFSVVKKIAEFFGVSVDALIEWNLTEEGNKKKGIETKSIVMRQTSKEKELLRYFERLSERGKGEALEKLQRLEERERGMYEQRLEG